jgi:hypothetical protein
MAAPRRDLMTTEIRRMRELSAAGVPQRKIAALTGRSETTVMRYVGDGEMVVRARRYDAMVRRVAAFVPVIGGGNG